VSRTRAFATGAALAATFVVLGVLNSGGYRYAASDQAFYIPAILRAANPELFPRDRILLGTQDHLLLIDEALAATMVRTGIALPHLLFAAYLLMLAAVAGSGWLLGRALFAAPWTAAALVLAMSIRHRIPRTGVNTLEHYFHPRMVAFAIGTAALAALARRRAWLALALAALAGAVHPTTGLWFTVAAGAGAFVTQPRHRGLLAAMAGVAVLGGVWLVSNGALADRLTIMDAEWLAVLASKDYLFPTEWSLEVWAQHTLYVIVVFGTWVARRRWQAAAPGESAVIAGLAAVLALFLLSLPFIHARLALAVQLQTSRTFWLFDLVGIAYAAWWLVEAPWRRGSPAVTARRSIVLLIALLALARGGYVMFVERAGNPVLQIELRDDDWRGAMRWVAAQSVDLHVLADPAHAWRFGSSVRAAAARDLYLEEVKDAAMAMYSREVAMRVLHRTRELGDFAAVSEEQARDLARRHDLDVLITERTLALPLAHQSGRFRIYRLREDAP